MWRNICNSGKDALTLTLVVVGKEKLGDEGVVAYRKKNTRDQTHTARAPLDVKASDGSERVPHARTQLCHH